MSPWIFLLMVSTMVAILIPPSLSRGRQTTKCNTEEICVDKNSCMEYINYIANKDHMTWEMRKDEREKLKGKICNKKPDKVCCKSFLKSVLPKKDQCGVSVVGSKSVVFGSNAVLGEFPWAALLGYEKVEKHWDNRRQHWDNRKAFTIYHCGGTLINTWFVLTAAHCQTRDTAIVEVVLGEWDLRTNPDCTTDDENCDNPRVQTQEVAKVIKHSGYDGSKKVNDIALVKMKKEVVLNIFVQLTCLPLPEFKFPKYFHNPELKSATVIGWGTNSILPKKSTLITTNRGIHGVMTPTLQKGRLTIQPKSKCRDSFPQHNVTINHLCAEGYSGHTDSCNGDSGGGLFVDSGDYVGQSEGNVHVLVGVVSYGGRPCGDSPSVYTKVDQFIPWIRDNIGGSRDVGHLNTNSLSIGTAQKKIIW